MNNFIWVWLFIVIGGPLLAPSLRRKTGSGDMEISRTRFVIFGLIFSAVYALAITGGGLFSAKLSIVLLMSAACLFLGFVSVAAMMLMYSTNQRPIQSVPFRRFRTGSIVGMCFAFLYTVAYLNRGRHFGMDEGHNYSNMLFFLSGAVGGAIVGAMRIRQVKRWIAGERIILPVSSSDQWSHANRKILLIGGLVLGVLILLPKLLTSSEAGQITVMHGFIPGFLLHGFIWVLQYEKRNDVRLAYEISEPDQPAELSAA